MKKQLLFLLLPIFASCAISKNYDPNRRYSKQELEADFTLLQDILESKHPALYWYTSKEEMDQNFSTARAAITDSMTELQFGWQIIAPVVSSIHCGHTGFAMSKNWNKFIEDKTIPSFPLYMKIWNDSMLVLANLNEHDTSVRRGMFVEAINGVSAQELIETIFSFLPMDGYANGVNYLRLSASFPYFHRNIFGLYREYFVNYADTLGNRGVGLLPFFEPGKDSPAIRKGTKRLTVEERLEKVRNVTYDNDVAVVTINRFMKGRLNQFYRRVFREIRQKGIKNLVIDLRANGGGDINKSVMLTRYIRKTKFKVSDSTYAISQNFRPFGSYISRSFWNNIGLPLVTRKKSDGNYHFGYWENHFFKPKKRNHFRGKVYVLIGGYTFSASSLFVNAVKGQENVLLVGEETGGGWYGNSGILIPDITLPNTKLRVRLPFFKIVQYQHPREKGTGVPPDIEVPVNWRDVLTGRDTKMEKVKELISGSN